MIWCNDAFKGSATLTEALVLFFVGALYKMWFVNIKNWKHIWKRKRSYWKYFLATGFFNNVKGIVTPRWMSVWQSLFHLFLSFLDFFGFFFLLLELPFENPKLLKSVSDSSLSLSDSFCLVTNLWVNAKKSIKFSFPNMSSSWPRTPFFSKHRVILNICLVFRQIGDNPPFFLNITQSAAIHVCHITHINWRLQFFKKQFVNITNYHTLICVSEAQKPKIFRIAAFYAQKFSGRSARIHFSRQFKKARNPLSRHIKKAHNPFATWNKRIILTRDT